ncbi:MAG: malectin domain-containing carbohydrate-binding protein [Bryobacteraceae bacterium]
MSVRSEREEHRAEFEFIMASGIFPPRSSPARFLEYVCSKYFEGHATVSECDIAVEALGRRTGFNPKQDAIVRVEAHRVRKRLSEFYGKEGAGRKWRLVIPTGCYLPVFTRAGAEANLASDSLPGAPARRLMPRFPGTVVALLPLFLALVIGGALLVRNGSRMAKSVAAPDQVAAKTAAPAGEVRIMAGFQGTQYTDRLGRVWSADRFYDGGDLWSARYRRILRTSDTAMFLRARQGSDFGYNIPLQPGWYEVRLYFAETFFGEDNQDGGGESSRIFTILANGVPLITNFDPLSDAGGSNTADVRVFKGLSPAPDGQLHIRFKPRFTTKAVPFVNAIEVVPAPSRAMLPIRWVASDTARMDSANRLWQPDQFCLGGRLRIDQNPVTGTADTDLYRSERYGHFSYAVPVADGSYTLTLHFAEKWFGLEGGDAGDARLFDVYCNGVALLRNFNIASEAGGSLKALKKTFRGLKPNAQGKLLLTFVPIHDYALVNALEVIDESAR